MSEDIFSRLKKSKFRSSFRLKGKELEDEGFAFGLWLLENASSPFLRGLAEALDEAEIRKKVGLGY